MGFELEFTHVECIIESLNSPMFEFESSSMWDLNLEFTHI
jgi:hypothetical protein